MVYLGHKLSKLVTFRAMKKGNIRKIQNYKLIVDYYMNEWKLKKN